LGHILISSQLTFTFTSDKKLEMINRPYFSKNQCNIAKEINYMFKENEIGIKLCNYIYYKKSKIM